MTTTTTDKYPTHALRCADADWKRMRLAALQSDMTMASFLARLLDTYEKYETAQHAA